LRVRISDPSFADDIRVYDKDGRRMRLSIAKGAIVTHNVEVSFSDGLTDVLGVDERACSVKLYREGAEVGQAGMVMVPGEITEVVF